MNRTEFAKAHPITILRQPFIFTDTPGQRAHAPRRKQAIREAMSAGIAGVINVVSFGYHEYRVGKSTAITQAGTARESFLQKHRKLEIEALDEWTGLLGDAETIDWCITVVTKADLWWDRKDEVLQYYSTGPYNEGLGHIKVIVPFVREYCSVLHKFYGEAPLSGIFDDGDRIRAKANLLSQLMAAIGKKGLDG
jgi:hypothetical protein